LTQIGGIVLEKLMFLKNFDFEQNNKKVGKFGLFSLFFIFFKGLQNLGKYFKPNFPIKVWRSNTFSQKLFIPNAKKLKRNFFLSWRKYF